VADDGRKRLYLEPSTDQETAAKVTPPKELPHGALPIFPQRFSPPSFGLMDYADLFTNRQLVFITTMMGLAKEAQNDAEKRAADKGFPDDGIAFADGGHGATAYAQAIRIALVLTISKLLDRCSNLCSWSSSSGGSLRNVFSRAAMPMIWDYAEGNPFADAGGSYANALSRTCETIAGLPTEGGSHTTVADCTLPNNVRNAILSTELPFYDKASYADLSDFFYVWLRYGLGDLYTDRFRTEVTPKKEELTAFTYRWNGDRQQANAFYAEGMNIAFKNMYESVTDNYPSTVAFQYKGNDAKDLTLQSEWEAFVTAICNAGFMITASWPLARKYEDTIELAESRGIPITVVIRRRPEDAQQTTRRFFVAAVKRELPSIVETIYHTVSLMDLRASVIGQALNIYSRYSKVLDADGTVMRPHMASRIIEQELNTILASLYKANESNAKEENSNG
jgi:putative DNA methylase